MPGHLLASHYPEYADCLLVAITEQRTRVDIDRLGDVLDDALSRERRRSRPKAEASA